MSWPLPENRASIFSQYCRQRYLLSAPPAAPSNRPTTLGQPLSPPTPGAINCSSIKISHFDRSSPFPEYRAYPWTLAPINPPFNRAHLGKQVIRLERATRGSGCVLLGTTRENEAASEEEDGHHGWLQQALCGDACLCRGPAAAGRPGHQSHPTQPQTPCTRPTPGTMPGSVQLKLSTS